jgi:cytosine/adenosine deaminase-related metal-dependent hydrolase
MKSTLIVNSTIITMNKRWDVFSDGYVKVMGDKIVSVGPMENCPAITSDMDVIDAGNTIMIPGLINAHTHLGMVPFRGLGEDMPDRLNKLLFPLEMKKMTKPLAKASAKFAIAEMQLSGITTLFDMYYFEDDIAQAAVDMRERAVLAETVLENGVDSDEKYGGLDYAEKYISKWSGKNPLITPSIAPHAPYSNTAESLVRCREIADSYSVPYMIHLAEMDYEMSQLKEKYNMTPAEYLDSIGFLGNRLVAAHCIHMNEKDAEILARHGTKSAHCIIANTKSGKGISPVRMMQDKGICVALGTDGPISGNTLELFSVMKGTALAQKTFLHDRSAFTSKEILKMATIDGAKALGMDDETGSIEEGKKADIAIIETYSANMYPVYDPYAAVVYQAQAGNVWMVYVNGEKVVSHKHLVSHSLEDIREELEETSAEFRSAAENY